MSSPALAELAAFREQFAGLAELDPGLGAVHHQVGALTVSGVRGWPDHPWTNRVAGLGAALPVREAELDEAFALLAGLRPSAPYVVAEQDASPRLLLPQWLAARGLAPGLRLTRLVAPARETPVPPGLRVVEVGLDGGDDVVRVCEEGFASGQPPLWWRAGLGRPGWHQLVGYDGDRPVATAVLHVAGPVAYCGGTTTVPAARGRGAQSALLAARLGLAARAGARLVTALADPASVSLRNLQRAGFSPAGGLVQWRVPAPASGAT